MQFKGGNLVKTEHVWGGGWGETTLGAALLLHPTNLLLAALPAVVTGRGEGEVVALYCLYTHTHTHHHQPHHIRRWDDVQCWSETFSQRRWWTLPQLLRCWKTHFVQTFQTCVL